MIDLYTLRKQPPEMQLLDYIQRLERQRVGRPAIHIHLSRLSPAYNQPLFLRIAADTFAAYLTGVEGNIFVLQNGDIVFIGKDVTPTLLESAVEKIRLLFSQDPLLEKTESDGSRSFHTLYDLDKDYDRFLALALRLNADLERKKAAAIYAETPLDAPQAPIEPSLLAKLESVLDTVDVTNISRRQQVCTLIDAAGPQPVFEEIFVSINELRDIITPGVDLFSNTWLFRYLTLTLDERIMYMLMRDGVRTTRPFSINLNISSILTPAFQKFEQAITPQLKGRLVIELNKLDVFSDMGAFMFVRDYLHDHGFRLCLDGLTHHTLPYYNRQKLGFDLVKLYWTPSSLDTMLPSQKPEIRNVIMDTGQAHTILCRCDDARAIETGQDLGIVMFQGREVDKRLALARMPSARSYDPKRIKV
jgi:EAL domain-containing protein (putative c-di-GMP-specific phosphodiesterase class I)